MARSVSGQSFSPSTLKFGNFSMYGSMVLKLLTSILINNTGYAMPATSSPRIVLTVMCTISLILQKISKSTYGVVMILMLPGLDLLNLPAFLRNCNWHLLKKKQEFFFSTVNKFKLLLIQWIMIWHLSFETVENIYFRNLLACLNKKLANFLPKAAGTMRA